MLGASHPAPARAAALVPGVLLVLAAVTITVWREPAYLLAPSFFAEEGNVYFFRAWNLPWQRTLLHAPSGYLLLFTNAAALAAAHLVPLRLAPAVTAMLALAVQALPVALIAFATAPEWRGVPRRAIGIAIVLFASLSDEIWLNTINSQCTFAVVAVLILLEPPEAGRLRTAVYAGLLLLAGSSGPVAAALAPLFAWRALRSRSRQAWVLAAAIGATLAMQAVAVLATSGGAYVSRRGSGASLATVGAIIWMRTIVLPVLGPDAAERFAAAFLGWSGGDLGAPIARATGFALVLAACATIAWLARPLPARVRIALGGGYVLATALVTLLASGEQSRFLGAADHSSRYFYAPGVVLLLLLAANLFAAPRPSVRRTALCGALLALGLGLGIARYPDSLRWRSTWPAWSEQVAAWERDPRRPLAIWPPGWKIPYLVPRGRAAPRDPAPSSGSTLRTGSPAPGGPAAHLHGLPPRRGST